ncbi:tRNA lysidine(34) synthetase TilS [Idiomarina tyrosinivorans]|uniref:tRNA(Ile)-lysidine synthase n=1 Tax=Idiomarina tyrosinivorans TaxID=1445662 RepID=A0A432ZLU0_9GAMM|nr:tRNA lysidine(34) synthetase TilS [Idiomarina tyrosinivorans]RUO78904.1 tRNA lysidine(34) synthetase TilS [Idiomarina tyrosinivorans]
MAQTLYQQFAHQLDSLALRPEQQIVVALGGGADSQTVLHLTLEYLRQHPQLRQPLAIHLDHHFHPDSSQWANALQNAVKDLPLACHFESLAVPIAARQSKEAAGRERRYQRLAELTESDAVILLGHHRNDQIETFLLQAKRGSGPRGLAAMAAVSPFVEQRLLVRPLLPVSKAEIIRYAQQHQLFWIEDDTNYDTAMDRNFLRHDIVPLLEQRWPQFGQSIMRSAALCAEQDALAAELLTPYCQPLQSNGNGLAIAALQGHSAALQRAILRHWLSGLASIMPSYQQLEQIRQQAISAQMDSQLTVSWAGQAVRYYQQALFWTPELPDIAELCQWRQSWLPQQSLRLPKPLGQLRPLTTLNASVQVGFSHPKGKLYQAHREGGKVLGDWLKQAKIAPWLRNRWPLLEWRDIWLVPGVGAFAKQPQNALAKQWQEAAVQWQWSKDFAD